MHDPPRQPVTIEPAGQAGMPILMGILNVTPDSFSDGGQFFSVEAAVSQGLQLARDGASIIDIGGESTRPGSKRVEPAVQIQRVVPVIQKLRDALDQAGLKRVMISIDTTRYEVALAALDSGAGMLNDVSGATEDARMLKLAADRAVPIVLMHMQGEPGTMQDDPVYSDVVEEVVAYLQERAEAATQAGVQPSKVWVDPGIGFGKTLEHNLALLAALDRFVAMGYPVLLGASRKRFIQACCLEDEQAKTPSGRLPGSLAAAMIGASACVAALRVHDVAEHRQALSVYAFTASRRTKH